MMIRTIAAMLVGSTVFFTAAPVFAETMVKEVSVAADLGAFKNPKAAQHYANLADDLKNAISARLANRIDPEKGSVVKVDIDGVALANSYESAANVAQSKLVGHVTVTSENASNKADGYDLAISFEQAGPYFVAGTDISTITTDSKEYYDAMIAAFADEVVKSLK